MDKKRLIPRVLCTLQGTITYPTLGSSENHQLKSDFLMGFASSQEYIEL